MNLSPNQIVDLVADATDKPNSIRHSLYAKSKRGDLPPRATEPSPRGGHPAIYFNIEDACALKLLYELGRIGFAAGTPVHAAAIFAMRQWSPIRPQVANYENPLQWAMAHVQSGGEVALAIYSARQGEKLGIVAAIFDTDEPIIPEGALVRIAVNLGDLLLPVLTRAEALRVRKVQ